MNIDKYLQKAIERTNIQHIRSFLMYGVENIEIDTRSYNERIEQYSKPALERLKKIYTDEKEFDEALTEFNLAVGEYQDVYLEIGMILGSRLLYSLLSCEN